jgi:NAD(P)-dependent dehydrogenase (short-subunit alcohol dehydrogenase family)
VPFRRSTEEETSNEIGDGNIAPSSAYTRRCCRQRQIASRKAAVAMMANLFAIRLAPNDIAVYEVRPGLIHTPITGVAQSRFDKLLEEGFTPINRWGTPEDGARLRPWPRVNLPSQRAPQFRSMAECISTNTEPGI